MPINWLDLDSVIVQLSSVELDLLHSALMVYLSTLPDDCEKYPKVIALLEKLNQE